MRDEQSTNARAQLSESWSAFCRSLERRGLDALRDSVTDEPLDLAEGLRYLSRLVRLSVSSEVENKDTRHPYFSRSLGPTKKMGGDNPAGLYLDAPINGTDTFRVSGTRGSAAFVSFMAQRHYDCLAEGLEVFGDSLFMNELAVDGDGRFDIILSPDRHPGNWIETDRFSSVLIVRQFFDDWGDVRPMDLRIENLTHGAAEKAPVAVEPLCRKLRAAADMFAMMVPVFQSEIRENGKRMNRFATDEGDPTSNLGGVPGGNAVTARWRLAPEEALLVSVMPPDPCPYWDAQVGNVWYESFDYRHYLCGLSPRHAAHNADGSVTMVVSDRDPGVGNWLEAAGHREGHIAIRWQLTGGVLPIPECEVVPVAEVAERTGLPPVSPEQRRQEKAAHREAVERRFRL